MRGLSLWFQSFQPKSKEDELSVRTFAVRDVVSEPFEVSLMARSGDPSIDLESIVGKPAAFVMQRGERFMVGHVDRKWQGICSQMEQIRVEDSQKGLSTYALTIVPSLWLLSQRVGYRVFQHLSIPDIVEKILREWSIDFTFKIDRAAYPKLEYRIQYGESEFAFLSRLLEEAGIAYTFPDEGGAGTALQFCDALASGKPHPRSPLTFDDSPNRGAPKEYVTCVQMSRGVRPSAYVLRDHDFRRPDFDTQGEAPQARGSADRLEQYHYRPGSMLVETGRGGDTPVADDKGAARRDGVFGAARATRSLHAERHEIRVITYVTNSMILQPGILFAMQDHPHQALATQRLLVTEQRLTGAVDSEWEMGGRAVFAADPYRPPHVTPKPEARGIETAVVVGPPGQEIHTDEFGRVRVQFPWDREGKNDDGSSCWMRVSQGAAGAGFGHLVLPRVGQEVIVAFLGGDPEQPIVVGRVFNAKNVAPYKLPEHKTRSAWKSASSPGGNGYNEIMFEDAQGRELVSMQAQRDLRKLVKNDETEVTRGKHKLLVGKDRDIVIKGAKKERIDGESHLVVGASRSSKVTGKDSLVVLGSRHESVAGRYAVEGAGEVRLQAGESLTIKGPGGFLRIDQAGITIEGMTVNINCNGVDLGRGPSPTEPIAAAEAIDEGGP